jgi:DNA-binding transcriptional LysR family regulator
VDRILDTDRLVAFVAVVREGGFSRAARALGKTQSAVSQAVLHLERELSVRLFVRDGHSTRPTEAGRLLLGHAERALAELRRAKDELSALESLSRGRVAIGTSDTLAYYLLPPVLSAFRARFPGVELRLDNRPSPATAIEVAEGRLDVGIVTLPLPSQLEARGRPVLPRLVVERLAPHDDVVIFPPGHALEGRKRVRMEDLAPHPLVLLDGSTATRGFLDAAFEEQGIRARISLEMSSVEVVKRLVELGFGVSVVPALSVTREVRANALVTRALAGRRRRHVGLVLSRNGPPSRAASVFAELLRGHFARGPERALA